MQTRAAIVPEPGAELTVVDVELDDPRDDEVLVRIEATGLCHTDLTVGSMMPAEMFPYVFGHEGAGVVEQVGARVQGVSVGDHVVLSYRSCRECATCRAGDVAYCEQHLLLNYMGMRMDGSRTIRVGGQDASASFFGQSSLAGHALAYADNVVVVDPGQDLAELAPYGCGYQTGAGAVLNVLRTAPDQSLVVYGAGAVGLAAVAAARGAGVETVVAVDLQPGRLALAQARGAVAIDASGLSAEDLLTAVRDATGGGTHHAIDTTAVAEVFRTAVSSLRPRGELVTLGLGAWEYTLDAIDVLQNGKTVRGCIEGDSDPRTMIPRLLELAASGAFDVSGLVTRYPFDDVATAVADTVSGATVKPVLEL